MKSSIYGLKDPITNEIRYIGQTRKKLNFRLYLHFRDKEDDRYKDNHKARWITKLYRDFNVKPIIFLIEQGDWSNEEINEKERYYIDYYRNLGYDLTNTSGKDYVYCPSWKDRKTRAKPVYLYDRQGIESIFDSAREAERQTGVSYKTISRHCTRKGCVYSDFLFSFKKLEIDEVFSRFKEKKVILTNIKTGEKLSFSTQAEASKALNLNFRNISQCLKGDRKSFGGFKVEFLKEKYEYKD